MKLSAHTSHAFSSNASHQAINPIAMLLRLADNNGMTLLQNLVYRNESLERLDLVGKDRLSVGGDVSPGQTTSPNHGHRAIIQLSTYTFMPAQKAADDLWSQV